MQYLVCSPKYHITAFTQNKNTQHPTEISSEKVHTQCLKGIWKRKGLKLTEREEVCFQEFLKLVFGISLTLFLNLRLLGCVDYIMVRSRELDEGER